MHYYKRNLGDYAKKAGRLSMLQHGAYTLLIDACYDREQFPTLEEALDWTWASSTPEIEAVEFVLRKFFTLEDGRYVQKRIEEEIVEFRAMAETNARIAQEREAKRKQNGTTRARPVHAPPPPQHEAPPNQEPLTTNQEPEGKPRRRAAAPATPPPGLEDVPERMLADYMAVRKEKRAGPLTDTAVKGLLREAAKAGITAAEAVQACCEFGWQGFNAGWYAERRSHRGTTAASTAPAETVYQRSMRERMQQAVPSIARRAPAPAQDAADFFRTVEVPARVVPDSNAIEVTP